VVAAGVVVGTAAVVNGVVVGTAAVVDAVVFGGVLLALDVVDNLVVVVLLTLVVVVDDFVVLLRGQVPGARSVRLVGVGVLGTLVFGAVPTVIVALPPPPCPSITMSMYSWVPSFRPAAAQARKWLPVLMVPPTCMVLRTDQYCWKSVWSPLIEGALVRFFCQIS
jgi:hypothetical protein